LRSACLSAEASAKADRGAHARDAPVRRGLASPVGGEWFLMWQSKTWTGSDAAARMFLLNAAVLIVLLVGRRPPGAEL